MEDHTLDSFKRWQDVYDYESDETTVLLLGINGDAIAQFNYPKFTSADFSRFKRFDITK